MGALTTCLGLFALFLGWILIGALNVVVVERNSFPRALAVVIFLTWLFSGPIWVVLFVRWRGMRFTKAYNLLRDKLNRKTLERLKDGSAGEPPR
jgi:hypothetical protein